MTVNEPPSPCSAPTATRTEHAHPPDLLVFHQGVPIHPEDGSRSVILTGEDGLQGPTSVALYGNRLYVLSAAFVLDDGKPDILAAAFHRTRHR
jgi:hypothetical protein